MAGFVDTVEQSLLNHFLTDPAYAPPATMYLGLSSTTPTDAGGSVTEPVGGGYARVATAAADWSAATGTAPAVKTTTVAKSFATASADWVSGANLTNFCLFSALSGGSLLAFGPLTTPKPVLVGDTPAFAAGALTLKLGDPTDPF